MSSHGLRQTFSKGQLILKRVTAHRLKFTAINGDDATKDNDAVYCVKRPEKSAYPAKTGQAKELYPGLIIAPRKKNM